MRPARFRARLGVLRVLRVLSIAALVVVSSLALGACKKEGDAPTTGGTSETGSAATKSYDTKGVIKSFGPEKKFANIAHENIPGYMSAMTMSFEAASPAQLEGLAVGDKVAVTFTADGGKHVIKSIKKEP